MKREKIYELLMYTTASGSAVGTGLLIADYLNQKEIDPVLLASTIFCYVGAGLSYKRLENIITETISKNEAP